MKDISKGVEISNEDIKEEIVMDDEETEEDNEPKHTTENKVRQRQSRKQISSNAKSVKCPECEAVFTRKDVMVRHYRSKHEGIKYPCNQSDYQATEKGSLQRHIQSKHEGIKYSCDQCDYQAIQKGSLKTHIRYKHAYKS